MTHGRDEKESSSSLRDENNSIPANVDNTEHTTAEAKKESEIQIQEDSVLSCNFLLWLIALILLFSVDMTMFGNVETYLRSLALENKTSLVAGIGTATAIVLEIGTGLISDRLVHRVDRIWFLVGLLVVQGICLMMFIGECDQFWIILSVMIAIYTGQDLMNSFGSIITFEYFGTEHFGRNWGFITFLCGIVALPVQYGFGKMYDRESPGESQTCYGVECFRTSSTILTVLNHTSLLTVLVLWFRRNYKRKT